MKTTTVTLSIGALSLTVEGSPGWTLAIVMAALLAVAVHESRSQLTKAES